MTPALASEFDERRLDAGAFDDASFATLQTTAKAALLARDKSTHAAAAAVAARRVADGGATLLGAAAAAAALLAVAAVAFGIVHAWAAAIVALVVAVACGAFAGVRAGRRRSAGAEAARRQAEADAATAAERDAAAQVARRLDPLGIASLDELERRRHRYAELTMRKAAAAQASERARDARRGAGEAAADFDALAAELGLDDGPRPQRLAAAKEREARRTARDGIDHQLEMLRVQRSGVLGTDDELALERELAALLAEGAVPSAPPGLSPSAFEAQRAELEQSARDAAADASAAAEQLRAAQSQAGDLAALDEEAGALTEEIGKLRAFEAAVQLARTTIDERTREAHQKFARRLEDYSTGSFLTVTDGRYADLRVDPTTLAVRLRVPETGAIHGVERLSAGTREQAFLIVRLAMARMFAEGSETLPLLLDDPFAFWDAERIARGLPVLSAAGAESQAIVFTSSEPLAVAAAAAGAQRIDM